MTGFPAATPHGGGASSRGRRRSRSEPTPYDFRRPVKLSREHHRTLQIVFETYARQASTVLTAALRSVCAVSLSSVEQRTYTEYVDSLDDLCYMTVFSLENIPQNAVLSMPLSATMACLDQLLGGPAGMSQPERPLTDLEGAVVETLFERLVSETRYALAALVEVEPSVVGVEYSPQLAQVATAAESMLVARFELDHAAFSCTFSVCFSYSALLPYLNAQNAAGVVTDRERAQREAASANLVAGFQSVPVDVSIRFRATSADPLELGSLRVGDVLRLNHPAEAPLDITAADVVFAHATPGSQGKRLACVVVAPPTQEN